jgi:hypothetical protein
MGGALNLNDCLLLRQQKVHIEVSWRKG